MIQSMTSINTNAQEIQEFVNRGVETVYPNDDFLIDRLSSGKQLSMYLGIDPTGPTLHLGHVITLRKLAHFQRLGHKVILLIGDFTAQVGDPTDKSETRKQLTHEEVLENARLYQDQASLFLDFEGDNPAELRYNSEWSDQMRFAEVMDLASRMTVQQMLERDMFRRRMESGKPIYIHEFFYPLMQGYDAVALDVDGEIGGNDQTFNMLVGRDLMKDMKDKEKFVLPMKLLTDTGGAKMGKTTGNMLSFLDTPAEKYGKVMSWTDGMIEPGFELLTDEPLESVRTRLGSEENPRDIKKDLARRIVAMFHDEEVAKEAQEHWETQFTDGGIPEDIPEHLVESPEEIMNLLRETGMVKSGKEARRKIDEGAVQLDGKKIKEIKVKLTKEQLEQGVVLKLGRKMFRIKSRKKRED